MSSCFDGEMMTSPRSESTLVRLAELVGRLGDELTSAAADVHRIEMTIGEILDAGHATPLQQAVELQRLDVLRQNLAELARFLRLLQPDLPGRLKVDVGPALSRILLADLRQRLAGSASHQVQADAGECEYL